MQLFEILLGLAFFACVESVRSSHLVYFPKLLRTSLFTPAMCYWEPVFSPVPGSAIKDMEMLPDHCVFTLKGPQGQLQLLTFPLKTPNDVAIHHVSIVV